MLHCSNPDDCVILYETTTTKLLSAALVHRFIHWVLLHPLETILSTFYKSPAFLQCLMCAGLVSSLQAVRSLREGSSLQLPALQLGAEVLPLPVALGS